MPAARTPMRQVREILRMKHEAGLPVREIVRRTGIPRRTVRELLERCAARGLGWPIAPEVSEADLEGLMFKEAGAKAGGRRRHEPDWPNHGALLLPLPDPRHLQPHDRGLGGP
jgi:GNAT superfamily N-acetyltransferase